jgi:hypothetical protein
MTPEKLAFYLRAALEWIDAVPEDVADRLPTMPGFDRDEADAALAGMPSGKMAPVQGYPRGIPWEMHLQAYDAYCKRYGKQPALIDLEGRNCRGGFGTGELNDFIPGWREKLTERTQLVDRIVALTKQVEELTDEKATLQSAASSKVQMSAANKPFMTFDDGTKVMVDSWTGSDHDIGWFGGLTLRFVSEDGTATVRGYQSLDTLKLGQLMVSRVEKVVEAAGIAHRLSTLIEDAEAVGLNIRVWGEPLKPLAMGHHIMRAEVYPARYPVVETHAEVK